MATYEVGLALDGIEGVFTVEDYQDVVYDWETAVRWAVDAAMAMHPDTTIDFLFAREFDGEDYADVEGFVFHTHPTIQ